MIPYVGQHVWLGDFIFRVKQQLPIGQKEKLQSCISFSSGRLDGNKGLSGLIKLMEEAVKAMSPGVNDPGTAIDAITKLIALLQIMLQFALQKIKQVAGVSLVIIHNYVPASEIVRMVLQPIRLYAKHDSSVMYELVRGLRAVCSTPEVTTRNRNVIIEELEAIEQRLKNTIENAIDKKRILENF